jgi:drug/metabolite transporter (DMT)-like permease
MVTNTGGVGVRPYVFMVCGCFWFSLMAFLANASGRSNVDWQVVAVARSGLATVFALSVALATGAQIPFLRPRMLWVRSIAGSMSMMTTFYALTDRSFPVSNTLTLTNTFPIWVALLSWPLAGERPTVGVWSAVVCAVSGVAVTQQSATVETWLGLRDGPVGWTAFPPAAWSALAASTFTATAMMGLNRLRGVSSMGVVVHFSAVATLFCLAAVFLFERKADLDHLSDPTILGLLLGVGLTATAGQVFLTLAFRTGKPTNVAVVSLSQVVMAMAVELAGGAQFSWVKIVGTILVLGPTAWIMVHEHKIAASAAAAEKESDESPKEEVAIE